MLNYELTGRKRYRVEKRLFRAPLIVLQVEEREYGVYLSPDPYDHVGSKVDQTYFRDAKLEDISAFDRK